MKHILKKNRFFLVFLAKFFFAYLILIALYQLFLNQFDAERNEIDSMTWQVATQVVSVLQSLGFEAGMKSCAFEACSKILVGQQPIVRVVEGCNAISVMILFTAFVVAFSGSLFRTGWYVIAGILVIHAVNIVRIVLLIIGIMKYPAAREALHDVVFPIIIYGMVFLLWLLWINKMRDNV